jgi:hypothetical protein
MTENYRNGKLDKDMFTEDGGFDGLPKRLFSSLSNPAAFDLERELSRDGCCE